ncbi:MAG: ABC transporter ATP-binding protein [Collinsella sp.]|nr:ABC transporter ATP-binding protein [Collinsella sp.]
MRIFTFLRRHEINLVIALALLLIQANCELTLPTIMSRIVDTGIGSGGIESVVPDVIDESGMDDVRLFLSDDEIARLDAAYALEDGVYRFEGDEEARSELEGFLGEAEMLAQSLEQGVSADSLPSAGDGRPEAPSLPMTGTLTADALHEMVSAGVVSKQDLLAMREGVGDHLGENGPAIIKGRAIEFVRSAYDRAGVDLEAVQTGYLAREGVHMLAYAAVAALCAILAALNASHTAAQIARDLRHDMYARVLSFSPAETGRFSVASLITRGTNDIQQVQVMLVMCMRVVLYAPCMGIGAVWRVLTFGDTGLQWIVVASIATIAVVIGVLMGLTMPRFRMMQKLVDQNNLVAREILTGIMPIRAFGRSRYEERRYDEANTELTGTYIFTNRAMSFMMPAMMLIMNVTSVAIVWFGAQGIDAGTLQVGDLMAYMNYTIQVIMSFMIITMISVMLPRADVAAERIIEVLETSPSISDPALAPAGGAHPGPDGWVGSLSFEDVGFTYPGADAPTIEHVSMRIDPGQTLGIIGSTGSGKSTLVQLIPRLFDATEGSVKIDGVDVRDIGLKELRSLIGFVPQKGVLFSGTIGDNIKFGDPSLDDGAMREAAEIAQATDFIEGKADGFDAAVSQGGSNVSGGQRQRLAIARALAIKPKILVFDDSFSALDYKTDAALRAALSRSAADATTVIVAQRIATIMHADRILVLEEGRMVGLGTHETLLRTCPEYLEIASSQLSEEELGIDSRGGAVLDGGCAIAEGDGFGKGGDL